MRAYIWVKNKCAKTWKSKREGDLYSGEYSNSSQTLMCMTVCCSMVLGRPSYSWDLQFGLTCLYSGSSRLTTVAPVTETSTMQTRGHSLWKPPYSEVQTLKSRPNRQNQYKFPSESRQSRFTGVKCEEFGCFYPFFILIPLQSRSTKFSDTCIWQLERVVTLLGALFV